MLGASKERSGESASLDKNRPWPGLRSYTEEAQGLFFGRSTEIQQLSERVRYEPLTILFGPSGLGKTSLLQAGLFPVLRDKGYVPVRIRLHFPESKELVAECDLRGQIREELAAEVEKLGEGDLAAFCRDANELWEVFHDVERGFLKPSGPRVVLVFDQFEELFTKGEDGEYAESVRGAVRKAVPAFMSELAALVENQPSSTLSRTIDQDESLIVRFDRYQQPFKMILALRDDFLGRLERYRQEMPSMMKNRMELCFLKGPQALEAVLYPGKLGGEGHELLDEGVAEAIVRLVAEAPGKSMDEIEAVPSWLLSLMCYELNERRIDAAEERIREEPLSTHIPDIFKNFYESSFRDLNPMVRRFVEKRLLSRDGNRESLLRTTAVSELRDSGIDNPGKVLDQLIEGRLLARDDHGGRVRIELAHDRLTEVAKASRDSRDSRERDRKLQEELEQRRITEERQTRELEAELGEMIEKLKAEWSCPTAGGRPFIQEYVRTLTDADRFNAFGQRRATALVLAAGNLLYVHAYIKEGLEAAKKALEILGYFESESSSARESSNITAAALCTYAKGLLETGKFEQAGEHFSRTLDYLNAPETLPTLLWDAPFFIRILAEMGIGDVLRVCGDRDQAVRHYDEVLEKLNQALGPLEVSAISIDVEELRSRISLYKVMLLLAKASCLERGDSAQGCYDVSKRILEELDAAEQKKNEPEENSNVQNSGGSSDAYREYLAAKLAYGKGLLSFNSPLFDVRNIPEALRNLQEAERRCKGLLKRDSQNWMWCSLQAEICWRLAVVLERLSQEAREELRRNPLLKRNEQLEPSEQREVWELREQLKQLNQEVEVKFSQMEKVADEIKKSQSDFIAVRYLLIVAHYHRCLLKPVGERLELLKGVRDELQKLIKDAPGNAQAERAMAVVIGRIGELHIQEQPQEALDYFEEALEFIGQKAEKIRNSSPFKEVSAYTQYYISLAMQRLSRTADAIRALGLAVELSKEIAGLEPVTSRYLEVASLCWAQANLYFEANDEVNAISSYESAAWVCDSIDSSVELMEKKGSIYLIVSGSWTGRSKLIQSCEALIKAASVLEKAFHLDPLNSGLYQRLSFEVHGKCIDLLEALNLTRVIGYGPAAEIAKESAKLGKKLREFCKEKQVLPEADLGRVLDGIETKERDGSDEISKMEGSERVDDMRKELEGIKGRRDQLLYPRDSRIEEGMLRVSEPQTWTVRPLIAGFWITLADAEQREELRQLSNSKLLSSEEKSLLEKVQRIRKLRLPCYQDAELFEAEVLWQSAGPRIWTYLRAQDKTVTLNGKSPCSLFQ